MNGLDILFPSKSTFQWFFSNNKNNTNITVTDN